MLAYPQHYKPEVVRLEMSNLLVVPHQQEELLLSVIITHGEQSVQIHGIHSMQQLYASSWDTLHLVRIISTMYCYGVHNAACILLYCLLGVHSTAAYNSPYTRRPASVTMYLGMVHCSGSESSLLNCNHTQSSFSDGNCEGGSFGEVVCQGRELPEYK